jgi:hypothetical protein
MDTAKLRALACAVLATALLSACGLDNHYYVKTDGSADVLNGVTHLAAPASLPAPLDVGVTFKSAGKVVPGAADALYRSVSDGLRAKGQWEVHRLGSGGEDFAPVITAVIQSSAGDGSAMSRSATEAMQRLLVLVEDTPDLSGGTQVNYFFSGMTFGLHSLHKATDHYDVTIAYRDANGMDHIYRNHQELLFSTGSKLFGSDDDSLAGLRRFDNPLAAFDTIVDNSLNGTQKKVITVGKPKLSRSDQPGEPAQSTPPAKP